MKHIAFYILFLMMSFGAFSQESNQKMSSDVTTYYLIRHAEKDRSNPNERNPHLKAEGLKRADNWSKILGNITFDVVYATNYLRTIETAQPTAKKNNLEIKLYEPNNNSDIKTILDETKGKTVLIVGHSDTIPKFVNAIIGQNKYEDIDDSNNGNLYIITFIGNEILDQVLTIN